MQLVENPQHLVAAAAVERAGRLVGEDDIGAVHQRAGDRDALLLSAGQLVRPVAGAVGDAEPLQQRMGTRPALLARLAGIDRGDLHIAGSRQLRQQMIALKDEAEMLAAQSCQIVGGNGRGLTAVDQVAARARPVEAAEDVHQRGFAGARCAHDGDHLAGLDGQIEVVERNHRALAGRKLAAQFSQDDHRAGHRYIPGGGGPEGAPASAMLLRTTTCSPSVRPDSTCAVSLLLMPIVTVRDDSAPAESATCTG